MNKEQFIKEIEKFLTYLYKKETKIHFESWECLYDENVYWTKNVIDSISKMENLDRLYLVIQHSQMLQKEYE